MKQYQNQNELLQEIFRYLAKNINSIPAEAISQLIQIIKNGFNEGDNVLSYWMDDYKDYLIPEVVVEVKFERTNMYVPAEDETQEIKSEVGLPELLSRWDGTRYNVHKQTLNIFGRPVGKDGITPYDQFNLIITAGFQLVVDTFNQDIEEKNRKVKVKTGEDLRGVTASFTNLLTEADNKTPNGLAWIIVFLIISTIGIWGIWYCAF